jgi:uncharacterized membrane protein
MGEKPKPPQEPSTQIERRKQTVRDGWYFLIVGHVFIILGLTTYLLLHGRIDHEFFFPALAMVCGAGWVMTSLFAVLRFLRAGILNLLIIFVMVIVAMMLLWMNLLDDMRMHTGLVIPGQIIGHIGWPLDAEIFVQRLPPHIDSIIKPVGLIVDILFAEAILFLTAYVCKGLSNLWAGKDWNGKKYRPRPKRPRREASKP